MTPPKNDDLMPDEIWAVQYEKGRSWYNKEHSFMPHSPPRTKYIRADIAAPPVIGGG